MRRAPDAVLMLDRVLGGGLMQGERSQLIDVVAAGLHNAYGWG